MFLFTIANIEINVTTVTLLYGAKCFTQHKTQKPLYHLKTAEDIKMYCTYTV